MIGTHELWPVFLTAPPLVVPPRVRPALRLHWYRIVRNQLCKLRAGTNTTRSAHVALGLSQLVAAMQAVSCSHLSLWHSANNGSEFDFISFDMFRLVPAVQLVCHVLPPRGACDTSFRQQGLNLWAQGTRRPESVASLRALQKCAMDSTRRCERRNKTHSLRT